MDNRFKLRVYSRKTGKMYKVHSLHLGTQKVIVSSPNGGNHSIFISRDDMLMQCTGLKDKSGKLIYEGDILFEDSRTLAYPDGKYWIVKWNKDSASFYIEMITPNKFEYFPHWHLSRHDLDYEVVGNIYENPELLEKK